MADTVLTDLKIHDFDSLEQMSQHESDIGENDLVFTPDMSAKLFLFKHAWADYLVSDMSWLRADTFSWHTGDVYVAAYYHLANELLAQTNAPIYAWVHEVSGDVYTTTTLTPSAGDKTIEGYDITSVGTGYIVVKGADCYRDSSKDSTTSLSKTETIGDITITYYQADDGHKICLPDQESNLVALYEATGVAWYYVLDTENKRFKLPRTKWGFSGLRDSVGGYVAPALPNITGTFSGSKTASGGRSGAFYKVSTVGEAYPSGTGTTGVVEGFDASLSDPTYQDGATVQPPATQMYLYFYVGNFEQGAVEQTAGLNAELFNGKADVDLNNINPSNSAKAMIVGWGMPDYSAAVSMSSGSSAPKNGWAIAHGLNASVTYSVNGVSVAQGSWKSGDWSGNWNLQIMVSAGDVVTGGSWKFIPCKGVN